MKQRPNSIAARDIASLLHPQTNLRQHLAKGPELTHRGSGVHVYDDQGSAFIDASSGLWCASLGFAVERLAKVAYEQMSQLSYSHLYRHRSHEAAIELAERLLDIAPVPMSKVLFQCSGSEANDVAIKLVWYYHNAIGKPEKKKIELSDNEKAIFDILKSEKRMDLSALKSQSGLSNKGWDKGMKGLSKLGLTKVEKTDDGLFVEVIS